MSQTTTIAIIRSAHRRASNAVQFAKILGCSGIALAKITSGEAKDSRKICSGREDISPFLNGEIVAVDSLDVVIRLGRKQTNGAMQKWLGILPSSTFNRSRKVDFAIYKAIKAHALPSSDDDNRESRGRDRGRDSGPEKPKRYQYPWEKQDKEQERIEELFRQTQENLLNQPQINNWRDEMERDERRQRKRSQNKDHGFEHER